MVSADDLAEFGRSLVFKEGSSELELRTGASRLYYSGFHTCLEAVAVHCDEIAYPGEFKGGKHERTFVRLERCWRDKAVAQAKLVALTQKARDMRELRVAADYTLDRDFDVKKAKEMNHLLFILKRELQEIYRIMDSAKRRAAS